MRKNPPGNLNALIEGIKSGKYANIAGGKACRSMVLAEDLSDFIPMVIDKGGTYNLTDGYSPSFFEISSNKNIFIIFSIIIFRNRSVHITVMITHINIVTHHSFVRTQSPEFLKNSY